MRPAGGRASCARAHRRPPRLGIPVVQDLGVEHRVVAARETREHVAGHRVDPVRHSCPVGVVTGEVEDRTAHVRPGAGDRDREGAAAAADVEQARPFGQVDHLGHAGRGSRADRVHGGGEGRGGLGGALVGFPGILAGVDAGLARAQGLEQGGRGEEVLHLHVDQAPERALPVAHEEGGGVVAQVPASVLLLDQSHGLQGDHEGAHAPRREAQLGLELGARARRLVESIEQADAHPHGQGRALATGHVGVVDPLVVEGELCGMSALHRGSSETKSGRAPAGETRPRVSVDCANRGSRSARW